MKKIAGIIALLLLSIVTAFAQEGGRDEKLPPLFKERRSGKVMFDSDAMREFKREQLEHSNAIFAKWKGKPCPAFAYKDLNGKEWTNESIRGRVTLINFWHSGSGPCIREMPWLNRLMEKYPRANFLASTFNAPAKIKKIVTETPFLYPQLADATAMWRAFGVDLSPTTILLDKEGRVFAVITGISDAQKRKVEASLKDIYNE